MRFDLEDRVKINLLCDLMKAFMCGKSNVLFVWHRTEGWAILQNQDYLDNLDSSNMVNLCQIKAHFFTHMSVGEDEFVCFEVDVSNYARVLKSIKHVIKRMTWQVFDLDMNLNKAQLHLNVIVEDGQLEVQREIYLTTRMNPQFYFRIFRDFIEDKTQYLEIKQDYMKQMKDLKKNECVYFKFHDEYVSVYNQDIENNNVSIKNTALEKYDYQSLIHNLHGKNRIVIPPNFLVPQIMMGIKLKDPIQLFISNDIIDDTISISLRTKSDSFTFISQFKSVMEHDEDDALQNPFNTHRLLNMHLNKNNNIQTNSIIDYGAAPFPQSVESHVNGLTNQMHLIDQFKPMLIETNDDPNNLSSKQILQEEDENILLLQGKKSSSEQDDFTNFKKPFQQRGQIDSSVFNIANSLNSSNQIHSVMSSQSEQNQPRLNKRRNEPFAAAAAPYESSDIFLTNKRIKESDMSSEEPVHFLNPLVSQDRPDNSFSSFIHQNIKDAEFSIFNSNTHVAALQFQPQKPSKNTIKQSDNFRINLLDDKQNKFNNIF